MRLSTKTNSSMDLLSTEHAQMTPEQMAILNKLNQNAESSLDLADIVRAENKTELLDLIRRGIVVPQDDDANHGQGI